MRKRIISFLIALCLFMSSNIFAAETENIQVEESDETESIAPVEENDETESITSVEESDSVEIEGFIDKSEKTPIDIDDIFLERLPIGQGAEINMYGTGRDNGEMTIDQYLGTSREKVLAWLKAHEHDSYYLGTPYAGYDYDLTWDRDGMCRPNGRYSGNTPQMNCTGFVVDALSWSGEADGTRTNIDKMIDQMVNWVKLNSSYSAKSNPINATFWNYFVVLNTKIRYYAFDTIEDALSSGKLKKGDIIYIEPEYFASRRDTYGNIVDCHIGFFWGDTPSEDKFWHSGGPGKGSPMNQITKSENQISKITPASMPGQILVFPLSSSESDEKASEALIRELYYKNLTSPFADMQNPKAYYYAPVNWATELVITKGYSEDHTFRPQAECTRAHIVTFVWRMAGCPTPQTTECPFPDVTPKDYYYKAVLWAAETGITHGYADGTFKPDETCLREHAITFIWRYAGEPEPSITQNPFNDIEESDYYYRAVLWANEKVIAKGYSSGEYAGGYGPKLPCLREHVVTFLYRYSKLSA